MVGLGICEDRVTLAYEERTNNNSFDWVLDRYLSFSPGSSIRSQILSFQGFALEPKLVTTENQHPKTQPLLLTYNHVQHQEHTTHDRGCTHNINANLISHEHE